MSEDQVQPPSASINRRLLIAHAAREAGHIPEIERSGKRFRIVCPCGWSTQLNWTRKKSFQEVADHQILAGRTWLGEMPAAGQLPPVAGHERKTG